MKQWSERQAAAFVVVLSKNLTLPWEYPLVNVYITIENGH